MELMGVPDVDVAGPVPIILFQKMCALHDSGQLIEAKSLCLEILKKYPEHVETINRFGTIVGQLGDLKLAIQVFRQAIVLDPSRVVSTYNRGIAFYNLGNFDAALLYFTSIESLNWLQLLIRCTSVGATSFVISGNWLKPKRVLNRLSSSEVMMWKVW